MFYLLFISRQFQKSKNDENPTSKVTCKTIFIILFKLFSIGDSFEFKVTCEMRLILVMSHCDSCENMKEFIMMSPHVMPCPIISQIMNMNPKWECEPEMRTPK